MAPISTANPDGANPTPRSDAQEVTSSCLAARPRIESSNVSQDSASQVKKVAEAILTSDGQVPQTAQILSQAKAALTVMMEQVQLLQPFNEQHGYKDEFGDIIKRKLDLVKYFQAEEEERAKTFARLQRAVALSVAQLGL
ncbi:hypothetical protein F5883DRAFT_525524 [Diaporthe sp. PMI_573]|nr:hypothetical protein F5883DRAFT_525524 [Diaporthaceae sp. PMI_573]